MIFRILIMLLCIACPLLSSRAQVQATTQPAGSAPAGNEVGLRFYVPQVPAKTFEPCALVVELENLSSKPVVIKQPIPALSAMYRAEMGRSTAGKDIYLLLVYFERPPGVPHDIDRDQVLHKVVMTVEPGKSSLLRVDIPMGILAPGDNRFTAVMHHDGADIGQSQPLVLHCEPLPAK